MSEPLDGERLVRAVLHDAFPAAVAAIALEVRDMPRDAWAVIPIPDHGVGVQVQIGTLQIILREELDRRIAKSEARVGGGT